MAIAAQRAAPGPLPQSPGAGVVQLAQTALIVDDEPHIRELVRLYLERNGFRCVEADDGAAALKLFSEARPALIILDLMLPVVDGWEVCRRVREESDTPIVMLTARDDDQDVVRGLEMGADDYVTKPFSPRELAARVNAVLRRVRVPRPEQAPATLIELPMLRVEVAAREVYARGRRLSLTPREFDLLLFLLRHPRQVLTREQLLTAVWGWDFTGDARTVDVHVKKLRRKLGDPARNYIRTVWGVGYKLEVQPLAGA